jgi:ATP-dependent DNA ligase
MTPGGCKAALPIIETLTRLRSRSCIIDGEAVACDEDGVTSFNRTDAFGGNIRRFVA